MAMVSIQYGETQFLVAAPVGQTLSALLQKQNIPVSFPCGGSHSCGKCLVQVFGDVSPISREEARLLPADGADWRLACFTAILGDCAVVVPAASSQRIASDCAAPLTAAEPLYSGEFGAAVDIGTTTVVAYLFRRSESEPLGTCGRMNLQRSCGGDVLSRISYCTRHTVAPLQQMIRTQISDMLKALCGDAGVCLEQLGGVCITGNTTMLHILTGLSPQSIGAAPFRPLSLFGERQALCLPDFPNLDCYLPPCISAYIGGDIVCSVLASGITMSEKISLLIDVGTNGELALWQKGTLTCCSTAAGPAFEGANISCGMQALSGAIHQVWQESGQLRYAVLNGETARGICGSGLIDAAAAAREAGMLDKRGRPAGAALPIGDSGVCLTRQDIQELLLAKAAIRAGIETLLESCAICAEDVERVILCGGFGSYMSINSATRIGLLPPAFQAKTRSIGNAAGAGAGMLLQNKALLRSVRRIADCAQNIDLSGNPVFFQRYIRAMFLP